MFCFFLGSTFDVSFMHEWRKPNHESRNAVNGVELRSSADAARERPCT